MLAQLLALIEPLFLNYGLFLAMGFVVVVLVPLSFWFILRPRGSKTHYDDLSQAYTHLAELRQQMQGWETLLRQQLSQKDTFKGKTLKEAQALAPLQESALEQLKQLFARHKQVEQMWGQEQVGAPAETEKLEEDFQDLQVNTQSALKWYKALPQRMAQARTRLHELQQRLEALNMPESVLLKQLQMLQSNPFPHDPISYFEEIQYFTVQLEKAEAEKAQNNAPSLPPLPPPITEISNSQVTLQMPKEQVTQEVKTVEPQGQEIAEVEAAAPEAEVEAVAPEAEVKAAEPEAEVKAAEPESEVEAAAPEAEVKAAEPESEVEAAAPESEVEAAAPESEVEAAAPEAEVEAVEPEAEVKAVAPEAEVEAAAPEAEVEAVAPETETVKEDRPTRKVEQEAFEQTEAVMKILHRAVTEVQKADANLGKTFHFSDWRHFAQTLEEAKNAEKEAETLLLMAYRLEKTPQAAPHRVKLNLKRCEDRLIQVQGMREKILEHQQTLQRRHQRAESQLQTLTEGLKQQQSHWSQTDLQAHAERLLQVRNDLAQPLVPLQDSEAELAQLKKEQSEKSKAYG